MSHIRVWFPDYYTEAHREHYHGAMLATSLYKYGIECVRDYDEQCQLIFCGSFFHFERVREVRLQLVSVGKTVPIIHYNWDMYPFHIEGERGLQLYGTRWIEYVEELKNYCDQIIVPSKCTIDRTRQYTDKDAVVVRSSVRRFDQDITRGDYVLDAMRQYPDPNDGIVDKACAELGLRYIRTGNNLPWEEYKSAVANCRFLVSAHYEASTGGLSALEAYALGKPVLLSNSPRHGGVDYFGRRATYFQWNSLSSLKNQITYLWEMTKRDDYTDRQEQDHYVMTEFSEDRMARELSQVFRKTLGLPERVYTKDSLCDPFSKTNSIDNEHGYIVYRLGTGDNLEILHIRAHEQGHGHGVELIREMLSRIKLENMEPYHSVFGFTKIDNTNAQDFYRYLGFILNHCQHVYQDGAFVFSIPYTDLIESISNTEF